jgi:hypothetical protein
MNNDKLNQWLTTLANFGVIVGIIFLVVEIRQTSRQIEQNTAALGAQTIFQINESSNGSRRAIAQDAELAELLMKGNEDPEALTELERERFIQWTRARLAFLEAYWLYRSKGLIDDRDAAGMRGSICGTLTVKGVRWVDLNVRFWEKRTSRDQPRIFTKLTNLERPLSTRKRPFG